MAESLRMDIKADIIQMSDVEEQKQSERTPGNDVLIPLVDDEMEELPPTRPAVSTRAKDGKDRPKTDLVYALEDVPPWRTTVLLGLQHFLTNFGGNVSSIFVLAPYLCISHDTTTVGRIIGTVFVVSGLITLLQSTFGVRLPIIQGTSFAFLVPTLSILNLRGECPALNENSTSVETHEAREEWLSRMREVQGAILVASCVEVVIGATGIVGILMNFIGPLSIATTISLIGLSLYTTAADYAGKHWGITFLTIALVILFSQYLSGISIPIPSYSSGKRCHMTKFRVFKVFPIILALLVAWLFCFILTAAGVFPDDPSAYGYAARTDLQSTVVERAQWFLFPYPGQWGIPTVSFSNVLGIVGGIFASIIESVGDYYACARMSGAPPPPQHAINRGILIEGIGCVLSGAWGSVNGTTSHSQNIGAIGITKVGSRIVVQAAGCIMIITGVLGKFGALFATIPEPVIGGVLCTTFGMVTAVGLSNLQFVDLNSSRNLFVLGFSTLMGLVVPYYMDQNPHLINTGSAKLDQIVSVVLTTGMFIGGLLAILLDNTIPGTEEERGIWAWRHHALDAVKDLQTEEPSSENGNTEAGNECTEPLLPSCYDIPYITKFLHRWAWCRYVPFSPTFKGYNFRWMKSVCKKNH